MTFKSNLRHLATTIVVFSLPLIFYAILVIQSFYEHGEGQWKANLKKSSFFLGGIALVTIPGFLLHLNYYNHDKGKSLKIQPTYLEISQNEQSKKFYFNQIQKVEKHRVLSWRVPWRNYGYTKIFLKNGEQVSFTCLLHDHISSGVFFNLKDVEVEENERFCPLVK